MEQKRISGVYQILLLYSAHEFLDVDDSIADIS
jgi:hypothetical protein